MLDTKRFISRLILITAALIMCSCAATVQSVDYKVAIDAPCQDLNWDQCAVAPQCRHNRAWTQTAEGLTETFVCESKPPVFVAGTATHLASN